MIIIFLRTIILYCIIVVAFRIMGKRQIGELEPSELVTAVLISELACIPMQDSRIPLLAGVVPVLTLLAFELLVSAVTMKSIKLRLLLCGSPSIVVREGKPVQHAMKKNRLTIDELAEQLRKNGITDISTVKYAILETDGTLSMIPYAASEPPTASDMGVKAAQTALTTILVSNGRVLSENLKFRSLDNRWLEKTLKSRGIDDIKDVFLLSIDDDKKIYLVKVDGA
ncbi:MAG: DUF421 domain-containing protein [Oscillospiraceae bacterium]|nr:DUF421 domain-containing protein [Oscillospiraceae bacterium]